MFKSLSISLLLVLVFTGCVFDDLSNCPRPNMRFFYSADGDVGNNVIGSYITNAKLFVYDEKGAIVHSETLPETALQADANFEFSKQLFAGNYTVVYWGNVRENSKIISENTKNTGRIQAPAFLENNKEIKSNDPLYFATKKIEVRGGTNAQTHIIEFKAAHIKFEFYARGLKLPSDVLPKIEILHLMPQYDFEMQDKQEYKTSYFPEINKVEVDGVLNYQAKTNVLRFNEKNDILIDLLNPIDNPSFLDEKLTLAKILELAVNANAPIDFSKQEITIKVYFDKNLKLVISIDNWKFEDVIPGVF